MYFMHDGAPAHFALRVRQYLDRKYGEKWIGRGGPIAWPPRSPDLNPLDFFFWGYLKNFVYFKPVETRQELWQKIVDGCDNLRRNREVLHDVIENMKKRLRTCMNENGGYIENAL